MMMKFLEKNSTPISAQKPEVQNYEYKFRRNGNIIQKPTDEDYSFATIKKNPHLEGLEGVDDYSRFTTEGKRNNLIYKFDNNNQISDFNFADNKRKEARHQKRADKGKRRKGRAFTINDDKVADEIFRAVAGNSNVEYIKYGYKENKESPEKNYIKTDRETKRVAQTDINRLTNKGREIIDITHSHPFTPSEESIGTKFASKTDAEAYGNSLDALKISNSIVKSNFKIPNHQIYHPWKLKDMPLPYTTSYNQNGTILPQETNYNKVREDYLKELGKTLDKNLLDKSK